MTHYRPAEQIKKFDIFKAITLGVLILALFLTWLFFPPVESPPTSTEIPTAELAAATTPEVTASESEAETGPEATLAAPTLNLPGGELPAGAVALTGTGEPGAEIEIVVDGQPIGKTIVGNDGQWSFTADLPKPGTYQVSVQNVTAAGQVLATSEIVAVKVAAAEEAVPTPRIIAPTLDLPDGSIMTLAGETELTGTGEPGSDVEIVVDGQAIGKTTVGNDGQWSFKTGLLPRSDAYEIGVQSIDASGKVLAASAPISLTVVAPTSAVTAPGLDLPSGELPAGVMNLTGTGEPGSEVQIVVDGEPVGKATVDSEGQWSLPLELPDPGDYDISLQSLDAGGAIVATSQAVAVKVAEAAAGLTVPTIDLPSGGLPAGSATLTGTGEPGSEVQVVVDGEPVGKATVDSEGQWSLPLELSDLGDYEISVQSVDASGQVLAASETVAVQVAEAEPTTTAPLLDALDGELAAGEVTLTGTGEPGSEVEIVIDGQPVGTATVASDGKWSFPTELTEPGDYELSLQSVDAQGQVVAASEATELTVTEEAESSTAETSSTQGEGEPYIVQADDWLSKIADKFYGDIAAYPTIVEATNTKAQEDSSFTIITNPDLIEIGQKLWIPELAP